MKQSITALKEKIVPVLKEAGVLRGALFGSFVRGDAKKNSDVDILVELPRRSSLLDLVRLEKRLKNVLTRDVDVVTYESIHPLLKKNILREQVAIL